MLIIFILTRGLAKCISWRMLWILPINDPLLFLTSMVKELFLSSMFPTCLAEFTQGSKSPFRTILAGSDFLLEKKMHLVLDLSGLTWVLNFKLFSLANSSQILIIAWSPSLLGKRRIREAFQSKNQRNLGISPNRGGVVKKSKRSQVSVGKSSIGCQRLK